MYMTLQTETLKAAFLPELPFKIYPMIGHAHCVASAKMISALLTSNHFSSLLHCSRKT